MWYRFVPMLIETNGHPQRFVNRILMGATGSLLPVHVIRHTGGRIVCHRFLASVTYRPVTNRSYTPVTHRSDMPVEDRFYTLVINQSYRAVENWFYMN